jgi:hypothetical protein
MTNHLQHASFVQFFLSCPWDKPATATQGSCGAFGSATEVVMKMGANSNPGADWVCPVTGKMTECKSRDLGLAHAPLTLYTQAPTRWFDPQGNVMLTKKGKPKSGANRFMWENYGYICEDKKQRLMTDLYIGVPTKTKADSSQGRRHVLELTDNGPAMGLVIDNQPFCEWDFPVLNARVNGKVSNNMAYISGRKEGNQYRITDLIVHDTPANFEQMLRRGDVTTALRMSMYVCPKKYGKPHDRGTAFRIESPGAFYKNAYTIIADGKVTALGRELANYVMPAPQKRPNP